MCFSTQTESGYTMYTHICPCTSLVLMPEEEDPEKEPGFSCLCIHIIAEPVHQWQGGNDAVKSHGGL